MDKKKMVIIGSGNIGLSVAIELAAKANNICALHSVVGSQFTEPKKDEVFKITKLPELEQPWIDPKEPVYNHQKHLETCAKNRKKRKNKKRR